jgi:hypothetical protein
MTKQEIGYNILIEYSKDYSRENEPDAISPDVNTTYEQRLQKRGEVLAFNRIMGIDNMGKYLEELADGMHEAKFVKLIE